MQDVKTSVTACLAEYAELSRLVFSIHELQHLVFALVRQTNSKAFDGEICAGEPRSIDKLPREHC
jgi:hypothetical protein